MNKELNDKQLSLKLPGFMVRLLAEAAIKGHTSMSWKIREYIREGLANEKP